MRFKFFIDKQRVVIKNPAVAKLELYFELLCFLHWPQPRSDFEALRPNLSIALIFP